MIAFNSQYSRYLWTRDINVTKGWINTRAYWPTSLFHHCDVAIYLCLFAHFEQRQVFGSDHFLAARTLVFPYPGLTPGPSHNIGPPGVRPSSRCCFRCCSCQRNQRERLYRLNGAPLLIYTCVWLEGWSVMTTKIYVTECESSSSYGLETPILHCVRCTWQHA